MTKEKRLFFLSSGKMINTIQVKQKKNAFICINMYYIITLFSCYIKKS